jgi:hypothetical protein
MEMSENQYINYENEELVDDESMNQSMKSVLEQVDRVPFLSNEKIFLSTSHSVTLTKEPEMRFIFG